MNHDLIKSIPGAEAFRDWFGWFPGFHDALATMSLDHEGNCVIVVKGFQMTERVKPDGFFELEKHFRAVLRISGISYASFAGFMPGDVILGGLDFTQDEHGIRLEMCDSAYGMAGTIIAQRMELEFEPAEGQ